LFEEREDHSNPEQLLNGEEKDAFHFQPP